MAGNKRSKRAAEDRAAKRRKEQDSLLENGVFTRSEAQDIDDSVPTKKSWDDEEQDYEMKPRTLAGYAEETIEGLPIKVKGKIERRVMKVKKEEPTPVEEDEEETEVHQDKEHDRFDAQEETVDSAASVLQLKEEIAELVENLMEDAEENIGCLTRLRKMAQSKNSNTCKFSMLALVPVFKSIIPAYRIRPLTESERREKVSKEVAKLRIYEESLVHNYKEYLDLLALLVKTPNNADPVRISLGNLAASAAVELLPSASS